MGEWIGGPVADPTALEQVLTGVGVAVGSDPATAAPAFNHTRIYAAGQDAYGLYYAGDTNFAQGWGCVSRIHPEWLDRTPSRMEGYPPPNGKGTLPHPRLSTDCNLFRIFFIHLFKGHLLREAYFVFVQQELSRKCQNLV